MRVKVRVRVLVRRVMSCEGYGKGRVLVIGGLRLGLGLGFWLEGLCHVRVKVRVGFWL